MSSNVPLSLEDLIQNLTFTTSSGETVHVVEDDGGCLKLANTLLNPINISSDGKTFTFGSSTEKVTLASFNYSN